MRDPRALRPRFLDLRRLPAVVRFLPFVRLLPVAGLVPLLAGCGGGEATTAPEPRQPPPEASTGTIEASVSTTGEDPDPDGYTLTLDGGESLAVEANGTVSFEGVEEGDHELELAGATDNCPVGGPNPRTVTVAGGETAAPAFELACTRAELILFVSDRAGEGSADLWLMRTDGSHRVRLTGDPATDGSASWSPDGSRIAFLRQTGAADELWVTGVDGSNATKLLEAPYLRDPRWSPATPRIAFRRGQDGGNHDVWVVGADGTNPTNVSNEAGPYGPPAWSPDGGRVAFESFRTGSQLSDIWAVDPDGSNLTNVTDAAYRARLPDWSPDGLRIAFVVDAGVDGLRAVDADGSNPTVLADSVGLAAPRWSPDGGRIALERQGDVWAVDPDGTNLTNLTGGAGPIPADPRWSPDGTRMLFVSPEETGLGHDVWVMGADGTDPAPLMDDASFDGGAEWRPPAP